MNSIHPRKSLLISFVELIKVANYKTLHDLDISFMLWLKTKGVNNLCLLPHHLSLFLQLQLPSREKNIRWNFLCRTGRKKCGNRWY